MGLSEYCDLNEKKWKDELKEKSDFLIEFLKERIDVDLYQFSQVNNNIEVYNNLKLWFLYFYKDDLFYGLKYIGVKNETFERDSIYGLMLSITRKSENLDFLIDIFKMNNIIQELIVIGEDKYKLITVNYGEINFETGDSYFKKDTDVIKFMNKMNDKVKSGCHEISFYLIKKYCEYKAVTSICVKGLDQKYYHSFVLDNEGNVIDLTGNIVMPKDKYYELNEVVELNCVNYSEFLKEKDASIGIDESGTLFGLLRCALYKQYLNEKNDNNNL